MKINTNEVKTVRVVNVHLDVTEVKDVVRRSVVEKLGLPDDMNASLNLRVDLSDNSTTYVRGELHVPQEEIAITLRRQIDSQELVSLRGTALATLAREPGDHAAAALLAIVDRLDGTREDLSLSDALKQSGNVLKSEDVTAVRGVYESPLTELKHEVAAEVVEALRVERAGLVAENEASQSWGAAVGERGERIAEIDRTLKRVEDEVGVVKPQVGVSAIDEASPVVERLVRTLRRIPLAVSEVRRHLDVAARLSPDSPDVAASVRVFEEAARLADGSVPDVDHRGPPLPRLLSEKDVESLAIAVSKIEADGGRGTRTHSRLVAILDKLRPGPALGDDLGVQVGTGTYAPESEELPEVQVDRAEGLHPLVAEFDDLFGSVGMMPDRRERVKVLRTNLVVALAGDVGPLVPRPTTDLLETAREKVKDLYERQYHQGQTPRAKDLVGLYKLLGGGDL